MVAPVRTLSSLIEEVRARCDQESSTFITDAVLETWINQSAADLYDLIYDAAGPEALARRTTITTVPGTELYELPADHYRLIGVDVLFGTRWGQIGRASLTDRNRWQGAGWTGRHDTRYHLFGRATSALYDAPSVSVPMIAFVPVPPRVASVRVWYLPLAALVITPGGGGSVIGNPYIPESSPLVSFNGWDEYVVADVCAKVLEKEESASKPFVARRDAAAARVLRAARQLDSAEPLRMRDALEEALADDPEPLWRD